MSAEPNAASRMQEYVGELERAGMHVDRADGKRWMLSGQCGGVTFEYRIGPAIVFGFVETAGWSLTLSVKSGAPGDFAVRPKGLSDGLVGFSGILEEFRTGDKTLDGKYYFSASTGAYAKEIFGYPENLDIARSLFAVGFQGLEKRSSGLVASAVATEALHLPLDALCRAVALLADLKLPSDAPLGRVSRLAESIVLYAVPVATVLVFIGGFYGCVITRPIVGGFMTFMLVTSPIVLIASAIALFAARGYLKRHPLIAAPTMGWLLASMPVLAVPLFGMLAYANERLDDRKAEVHEVRQVHRVSFRSRRATGEELVFKSWRGSGTETVSQHGHSSALPASRDGQLWRLYVRPGLLGRPWVESLHPL